MNVAYITSFASHFTDIMKISDAITSRRTIKDFEQKPVADEIIERALSAGLWAQNHRVTQPWRFTILGPQTHRALAEIYGAMQAQLLPEHCSQEQRQAARAKGIAKLMSKPRLVAAGSTLADDSIQRREDYAAVCCAIQNIALAAWSEGLGMQWSTGKVIARPETYQLLGIDAAQQEIVGLLYFGFPAQTPAARARKPLAEVARFLP
jgi:nitroreductase